MSVLPRRSVSRLPAPALVLVLAALVAGLRSAAPARAATFSGATQISTTGPTQAFAFGAHSPSLAYDAVSGHALAVWQVFGIGRGFEPVFARLLDPQGRPLGPEFAVAGLANAQHGVAVTARGSAGGFLIAAPLLAPGGSTSLVDVAVAGDGHVGPVRALSPAGPYPATAIGTPSIAFRGRRGLVAWSLNTLPLSAYPLVRGAVRVRAINASGMASGPTRTLAAQPGGSQALAGEVSLVPAASRGWLVVWSELDSYAAPSFREDLGLFARPLGSAGVPSGPGRRLAPASTFAGLAQPQPTLLDAVSRADPLVLYAVDSGLAPRHIAVLRVDRRRLTARGAPAAISAPAPANDGSLAPLAGYAPALHRYLLVYSQSCDVIGRFPCPMFGPLVGQLMGTDGRVVGPVLALAPQASGDDGLVRTGRRTFLVAWTQSIASGQPFYDPTAMFQVTPQKSEVFVRAASF